MGRIAVVIAIVAVVAGTARWVASTHPANPISGEGLGFEGVGEGKLSVGEHAVFMGFLVGRSPDSRATVTGYTLPHVKGVRLALYAVRRPPHVSLTGVPTATVYAANSTRPDRMGPLVDSTLGPPPPWLHTRHPVLMVALDVTLLRQGCVHIDGGVHVRYRAGGATFTRSMRGADSVGTSRFC